MKLLTVLLGTYTAFALQLSLAPEIAVAGCGPQFVVWWLIGATAWWNGVPGLLAAGLIGLLSDGLAANGFGVDVVCFTWIAWTAQRLRDWLGSRTPVAAGIVTALLTMAAVSASAALRLWWGRQEIEFERLLFHSIGTGLYTGMLAFALWIVIKLVRGSSIRHPAFQSSSSSTAVANRWKMLTE